MMHLSQLTDVILLCPRHVEPLWDKPVTGLKVKVCPAADLQNAAKSLMELVLLLARYDPPRALSLQCRINLSAVPQLLH